MTKPSSFTHVAPAALVLVVCAAPCTTQEATPTTKPKATGSALIIETGERQVASRIAEIFGSAELPSLEQGQHYVLSLDDGGKLQVKTTQGPSTVLRLRSKPRLLLDVYRKQVEEAQQMASMMATMGAAQGGMEPKDLARLIDLVFDLPNQIDSVEMNVDGSKEQGYDAKLSLLPVTGTWLGKLIAAAKENEKGAPSLPDPKAPLGIRTNVHLVSQEPLFDTFMGISAGIGAPKEAEKKKRLEMLQKSASLLDGTAALSFNPESGVMQMLSGLRDAKAYRELITGEEYQKFEKAMAEANPSVDVQFDPKALQYKEVVVSRITTDMSGIPNPLMPEGKMAAYHAVVGDWVVAAQFGAAESDIKRLIDKGLERKIERTPLQDSALVTLHAQVATLAETLLGNMGMQVPQGLPEAIDASLRESSGALELHIHVK